MLLDTAVSRKYLATVSGMSFSKLLEILVEQELGH